MIWSYARVSGKAQDLAARLAALEAAGRGRKPKLTRRPAA